MTPGQVRGQLGRPVLYRGAWYVLKECVYWRDGAGMFRYSAVLLDKSKNSVIRARLEEVEPEEEEKP